MQSIILRIPDCELVSVCGSHTRKLVCNHDQNNWNCSASLCGQPTQFNAGILLQLSYFNAVIGQPCDNWIESVKIRTAVCSNSNCSSMFQPAFDPPCLFFTFWHVGVQAEEQLVTLPWILFIARWRNCVMCLFFCGGGGSLSVSLSCLCLTDVKSRPDEMEQLPQLNRT